MKAGLATLVLTIAMGAQAQTSLKDAPATLEMNNWTVLRQVDPMTDKVSCTGIYKKSPAVQVSSNGLYIRVAGGLESVTLRFDNEPARAMRLPTTMEKQVRAIILDGGDYQKALESTRIRYESLLLIRGMASGDLDISGIKEVAAHIANGCPLPN